MRKLALILALLATTPVEADELTAGLLYSFCNAKDELTNTACRFYILGVVQGIGFAGGSVMNDNSRLIAGRKTSFCAPENMSGSEMVAVFQKSMQSLGQMHAGDFKLPAVSLISAAMNRAFPCPK
jgi:hypothetical protein